MDEKNTTTRRSHLLTGLLCHLLVVSFALAGTLSLTAMRVLDLTMAVTIIIAQIGALSVITLLIVMRTILLLLAGIVMAASPAVTVVVNLSRVYGSD